LVKQFREVKFVIVPKRNVNKIDLYPVGNTVFKSIEFNGEPMPVSKVSNDYRGTENNALINYYVSQNDSLKVAFSVEKDAKVSFKAMEYSFDLMSNSKFTMIERPTYTMPKPFVITDAIMVKRTFSVDSLKPKVLDTLNFISPQNE